MKSSEIVNPWKVLVTNLEKFNCNNACATFSKTTRETKFDFDNFEFRFLISVFLFHVQKNLRLNTSWCWCHSKFLQRDDQKPPLQNWLPCDFLQTAPIIVIFFHSNYLKFIFSPPLDCDPPTNVIVNQDEEDYIFFG